ncbi:hypothetical protein ABW21_db0207144 [Orbilia brochopaga]|nr:hypothetical protein ABW21_db0207144 [Drechslerella brochopaga]
MQGHAQGWWCSTRRAGEKRRSVLARIEAKCILLRSRKRKSNNREETEGGVLLACSCLRLASTTLLVSSAVWSISERSMCSILYPPPHPFHAIHTYFSCLALESFGIRTRRPLCPRQIHFGPS